MTKMRMYRFPAIGEICISGNGVTEGYLNQPDLTADKFISLGGNKLLYRTGDLARLLPDGKLLYLGRKDHQVNLHGHRIELGEIDTCLNNHNDVSRAVTLLINSHSEVMLVSFIVSTEKNIKSLKDYLARSLPQYMVPVSFQFIDEMPVDKNGKVDRNKLKNNFTTSGLRTYYEKVTKSDESKLASIWENILSTKVDSRNANFFELGGNSLKVSQLIKTVDSEYQIKLEFRDVFTYPVLHELTEKLASLDKSNSIPLLPIPEKLAYYDVSNAQRRLWLLCQYDEVGAAYNIPIIYELNGELDIRLFSKAFSFLIKRHESFRTNFSLVDGELKQFVNEAEEIDVTLYKLGEYDLNRLVNHYLTYQFDLEKEKLFQIGLAEKSTNEYLLLFTIHHIISDGWSISVFVKELFYLYNSFKNNITPELKEIKVQYKDYAAWQKKLLKSNCFELSKSFWLNEFKELNFESVFPLDFPRTQRKTYSGSSKSFVFSSDTLNEIKSYTKSLDITLYMYLVSIVNVVLYKYSRSKTITIGSPIASRSNSELDSQIGFYANTVAIKNEVQINDTFEDILLSVKKQLVSTYEHQDYPFDELIENLGFDNTQNKNPLFDIMVILQNANETLPHLEGIALNKYPSERKHTLFDLTFKFEEINNELEFELEFNTDLFQSETASKILADIHFVVLKTLAKRSVGIKELIPLSGQDKTIIAQSNQTNVDFKLSANIIELFEEQVAKTPNNIALTYKNQSHNYDELNKKVNQFTHFLIRQDINKGDRVAIHMERSDLMVIAVLGVLKVGASFVPVDMKLPDIRKKHIWDNTRYIIGEADSEININTFKFDEYESSNIVNKTDENDIAYLIYTSGSTGIPKGVQVTHQNFVNYIQSAVKQYSVEQNHMPFFTTLAFDFSLTSIFLPLLSGGKVTVLPDEDLNDTLYTILKDQSFELIKITPAHIDLIEYLGVSDVSLKHIVVGGDALYQKHIDILLNLNSDIVIFNEYGPTETTVGSVVHEIRNNSKFGNEIGKPIANTRVYVLDEHLLQVPVGTKGELYISGFGVSEGYLNNNVLNKERFLENPNSVDTKYNNMYKTGDIVRWLPDGNLEYFGREDNQIKIRGNRVELGEVEQAFYKLDSVKDVCVLPIGEQEKYLHAFIVGNFDEENKRMIQQSLFHVLPNYMVPKHFTFIQSLPLTINGKVDKKALLGISINEIASIQHIEAETEVEQKLCVIFQDVLNLEEISVQSDFYFLGVNSLKAMQIVSQLYSKLYIKISLRAFFKLNTIRDLGNEISQYDQKDYFELPKRIRKNKVQSIKCTKTFICYL